MGARAPHCTSQHASQKDAPSKIVPPATAKPGDTDMLKPPVGHLPPIDDPPDAPPCEFIVTNRDFQYPVRLASGARRVYLNKNKAPNARGSKFGLPKPGKAGRYEGELLLREDQLHTGIWRQKAARARSAKAARSVFGPEVTESLEALQLVQRANLTVGVGRKNPNAMSNGRERRGKPRKKK